MFDIKEGENAHFLPSLTLQGRFLSLKIIQKNNANAVTICAVKHSNTFLVLVFNTSLRFANCGGNKNESSIISIIFFPG